jgi:hypothetical protein
MANQMRYLHKEIPESMQKVSQEKNVTGTALQKMTYFSKSETPVLNH